MSRDARRVSSPSKSERIVIGTIGLRCYRIRLSIQRFTASAAIPSAVSDAQNRLDAP